MTTIEEVEKSLRNIRLHGMAQTLQARCLQAQQNGSMSVLDVLTQLVGDELDCRQSRLNGVFTAPDSMNERSCRILTGLIIPVSPDRRFWS